MTTFTVTVSHKETKTVNGTEGVVVRAYWAYVGTVGEGEEARSESFGGSTDFTFNPAAPFTPLDELTDEQVASWILGSWTVIQRESYEQFINYRLGV